MCSLIDGIENSLSEIFTENGAKTYSTSLSSLVDFFALGASMRTRSTKEKVLLFSKAMSDNKLLAMKALFYIRDCRGGQGERTFFRDCFSWLANNYPEIAVKNFDNVVKFGRFDDLFVLRKTAVENEMVNYIRKAWRQDVEAFKRVEPISLLAKWMPSENASKKETVNLARWFIRKLKISNRNYRKTLSILRKQIDIVEVKMSKNAWNSIEYEKIPSYAAKNYRAAFGKHDGERYSAYLEKVKAGKTKIHSSTLYPYDLLKAYLQPGWGSFFNTKVDPTIEAQWNALPDYFDGRTENSLCVVDTSGSMSGIPICVAVSLGLYTAERNKGLFKDCFISFSARPQLHRVKGETLLEKARNMSQTNWDMNTNLEAVFNVILEAAIQNKVPRTKMVKKIYIISDMEFDRCVRNQTLYSSFTRKFKQANFEVPEVVFWNVSARNNNLPVRFNEQGVALVSGMSPAIFETVVGRKITNPLDVMLNIINKQRYNTVVI